MVYDCQNEVTMKPIFLEYPIIYRNFATTGYHAVTLTKRYGAKTPKWVLQMVNEHNIFAMSENVKCIIKREIK